MDFHTVYDFGEILKLKQFIPLWNVLIFNISPKSYSEVTHMCIKHKE